MPDNNDLRDGFFQECEDLLETMSDGIAAMDGPDTDSETVNSVFRAVHSIKGGASAFGLEGLVEFAHGFENALDDLRSGYIALTPQLMALLYRSGDRLADLVAAARDEVPSDPAESLALLSELDTTRDGAGERDAPPADARGWESDAEEGFAPLALDLDLPAPEPGPRTLTIRFAPSRELYATGNEPAMLFRALGELGTLTVRADLSGVPPLGQLACEESYITWELVLGTEQDVAAIREVFEFVEGMGTLEINEAHHSPNDDDAAADSDAQAAPPTAPPPPDADADATSRTTATAPDTPPHSGARPTIRVDLERVDRLINLVGELVISEAMLSQSIVEMELPSGSSVESSLGQLKQLSSELQERVMAIRAQPVKSLFQRMSRIVREAGKAADKPARLVTEGETTEVDKTVIERLADPLTHMIRNAVDHGIESAAARVEAGKPETGTITLSAAHRSGRVIIEIRDDGGGVNRRAVREKAVARGLIAPEAELTDAETDNLLFAPGFSTAEAVSSLSGRGVGMDVVKSEIQALGGRVSVASQQNAGTTVTISLPLTLAVLEGMVVDVAGETVVVPTTALRETLRAEASEIHVMGARDRVLSMRGALVPIVDLGASLGFRTADGNLERQVLLLVESESGHRTALAVDRVFDQREVVIKGLQENYGHIPGVAAATILGDGRIALIIDTDQITTSESTARDTGPLAAAAGA